MNATCHLLTATGLAWLMLSTAPVSAETTQLLDGTVVQLRLLSPITSEDARAGDRIRFLVTRDVVRDGVVVIARGTPADGAVVAARRASWGFIWHKAALAFAFTQTTAVDGQTVTLRAPNAGGVVSIDRSDYHHNLQWATEGDPLEASIVGNYAVGVR
jgi:hypothetical protein